VKQFQCYLDVRHDYVLLLLNFVVFNWSSIEGGPGGVQRAFRQLSVES